jgi:hypothetical protein
LRTVSRGIAEVAHDVELVEQDVGLRRVALGGIAKRLPHIHHRQLNAPTLLRPEPGEELVHAGFRPVRAAEPDRAHPIQIADYDPVGVPLADQDLVDANSAGGRGTDAPQLRAHVLHLQALDGAPIEMRLLGDILDRGHSAAAAHPEREPLRVERMVGQPAQAFLPHRATPAALHPPHRQLQVNPRIATRQIAHPPGPLIVERPMGFPADATRRFFRRRTSCTMRTCGSPNTPRTVANGWKPGKRYASCNRRRLRIAISCQISPSQQSSQTLVPRGLAPRDHFPSTGVALLFTS